MARSRREFLAKGSMGLVAAAMAGKAAGGEVQVAAGPQVPAGAQAPSTPGAQVAGEPGAFGTAPATGPEVGVGTFREAEKLVQVEMSGKDLAQAAGNWRQSMAAVYERRVGPRKVAIGYEVVPATVWNPLLPKMQSVAAGEVDKKKAEAIVIAALKTGYPVTGLSSDQVIALPAKDEDIAFAPVWQLSRWIEAKAITSERLTGIYLERLERFNKELNCVITLTREHAMEQARASDREIAAGKYRGPLHGIPWGLRICWIRLGSGRRGERSRFGSGCRWRMLP